MFQQSSFVHGNIHILRLETDQSYFQPDKILAVQGSGYQIKADKKIGRAGNDKERERGDRV